MGEQPETVAAERVSGPTHQALVPQPFPQPYAPPQPQIVQVTVVDFDVSFGRLIGLWIKVALAAIPALLVLGAIGGAGMLALGIFGAVLSGIAGR